MKKTNIITRIAPSPTGLFHIGTARTALFNFLFARKNNGKFIFRIEDTDSKRSKKEYVEDIISGLQWLGLVWDGEIFYQSKRQEIYQKWISELITKQLAYKKDGAIWFNWKLATKDISKIKYHDLIKGDIEFDTAQFNDFVLIKKDGIPLYMFAAVIDDHEMKISHVIRGDDHINSTPQQIILYKSLGWPTPEFAHMPLILNQDKSKMSKRKDPVSVTEDFHHTGYLPEAMINFMALLGWNPKNNQEFFLLQELIQKFDLAKVNKSPAIFDLLKLNYFNNHYLKTKKNSDILKNLLETKNSKFIAKLIDNHDFAEKIIDLAKTRMNNLQEFDTLTNYIFKLPDYDKNLLIFKKSSAKTTLKGLQLAAHSLQLANQFQWTKIEKLNDILLATVQENNLSNGDVFWPVRVALSGLEKSFSPVELLWILGKNETITRLKLAIKKLNYAK